MTTFYLDFEGGSDAADGTSYANRWLTLTNGATAARIAPGDTIRIMGSPAPTSLGMTAAWANLSPTVTLNSAVTANISLCQAGWTNSANVSGTTSTTRKQGTVATEIIIASGFTTGLAAYEALGGATDFSGYQQVSFWIRQSAGTQAVAGDYSLRLCSDAAGVTTVNTIAIPAIPSANHWQCVTVDTGGALGASIQSVALYVDTDRGAVTFQIDNIIACKASSSADSLTLNSLIGKNADDGLWWPIRSIDGTTVTIDSNTQSSAATASRGYVGTSETVTTYKREPIRILPATGNWGSINDSGTSGSPITFSGGWNRTDMSTQDGETWVSNTTQSTTTGINVATRSWITFEKLSMVRFNTGFAFTTGVNNTCGSTCHAVACSTGVTLNGVPSAEQTQAFDFGYAYAGVTGIQMATAGVARLVGTIAGVLSMVSAGFTSGNGVYNLRGTISNVKNNGTGIFSSLSQNWDLTLGTVSGNSVGINLDAIGDPSNNSTFRNGTFSGNTSSGVSNGAGGTNYFFNCTMSDTTEFGSIGTAGQGGRICSTKHDGTADNHYIWDHLGVIKSEGTVRHTASGIAWKMSPTTAVAVANAPLTLAIARIACNASAQVTVKAYMRRTNTGLTMKLVCRGGQIGGVASDVSASMAAAADTWEELTINFTPNEAGVVEIEAQAYGGTTYSGYVDDLTISQA